MSELNNCPFCGANPIGPEHADSSWLIECEHCEIVMDRDSKSQLIEEWNKRPDLKPDQQQWIEELKEIHKMTTNREEMQLIGLMMLGPISRKIEALIKYMEKRQ